MEMEKVKKETEFDNVNNKEAGTALSPPIFTLFSDPENHPTNVD